MIPAVALGELFFGASKSSRPAENLEKIERFASGKTIILSDLGVAREYGRLKQELKANIWIAGCGKTSRNDSRDPGRPLRGSG
jgi:predicted nucleic acid-binding protein